MFSKKVVFKSFLKLKGKHLCRILFLNKVWSKAAGLLPATLLKKRLQDRCFSVNFAKFVRTTPVTASSGLNNVRSNLY